MKLRLGRKWPYENGMIGELSIDGVFECFTLEDPERDEKIPGKTAIPRGTYRVAITWSEKFQKKMPEILDVPGFEGVRIHVGNTEKDTEGCVLVGKTKAANRISDSRMAFAVLYGKLLEASKENEEITIEITGPPA